MKKTPIAMQTMDPRTDKRPHSTPERIVIVDQHGNPYGPQSSAYSKLKKRIDRVLHGEGLMGILTFVIASSTLCQLWMSCNNNQSTSKQVDKLIVAANHIDEAADSFSKSATNISQGMYNAVAKLDIQAGNVGRVAGEAGKANQLSKDALEARLGVDRPILEVTGLTGFPQPQGDAPMPVIRADATLFMFTVINNGLGQAVNIRYRISHPHRINWESGDHAHIIEGAVTSGERIGENPLKGSIPDILGKAKSSPIPIRTEIVVPGAQMYYYHDDGEYFFGELDWDDIIGFGHKWQNTFCLMAGVSSKGEIFGDCGIKEEGVHPRTDIPGRRLTPK